MKNLILLLLCFSTFFIQAQLTLQKTYGRQYADFANSIEKTFDGGFILCGTTSKDSSQADVDVLLLKLNAFGDTLWTKSFGGTEADFGEHAQQTADSGYVIIGMTNSFPQSLTSDIYFIKTDKNGDTLYTRTYGSPLNDELGQYIQQTSDGGYIITGHSDSFGFRGEFYVVRTKPNGDTLWTKIYGGLKHDHAFCGKQTLDGGFIFVGHTLSFGDSLGGFYAVKTDSNGDTLWTRAFGGTSDSYCFSVQQTTDSGYVFAGITSSFGAGATDFYLVKTNSVGDTLFTRTYGGTGDDICNDVKQTTDGGFILTGYTNSFSTGDDDVYLIKTNATGDILFAKTYGSIEPDEGFFGQEVSGGYVICGTTKGYGAQDFDAFFIKTDSLGNTFCGENNTTTAITRPPSIAISTNSHALPTASFVGTTNSNSSSGLMVRNNCNQTGIMEFSHPNTDLKISPNPNDGLFTLTIGNSSENKSVNRQKNKILITNTLGEIIYSRSIENTNSFFSEEINLQQIPSGTYFLQIQTEDKSYIKKIIILK